jgi:hypothetical protein
LLYSIHEKRPYVERLWIVTKMIGGRPDKIGAMPEKLMKIVVKRQAQ